MTQNQTTQNDDNIALAAEYVLGTLDLVEREEAERLIANDANFAALVRGWESRLNELHAMAAPIEPPATTWDAIKRRIASLPPGAIAPIMSASGGEVISLSRRVRRWQGVSTALGALAAALIALLSVQAFRPDLLPQAWREKLVQTAQGPAAPAQAPVQFVAVLQKDADAPAFIMTVDVEKRAFTVRRVAAQEEPGKSYELWIVSDKFDKPRSLGVIGGSDFTMSQRLAAYDPETINKATYAVSIEPEGGSPTGVATGPVVFAGKLIEAAPGAR